MEKSRQQLIQENKALKERIRELESNEIKVTKEENSNNITGEQNKILASVPSIIYIYEIENNHPNITYVNENIKNTLGYEPSYLLNNSENWFGNIHPEDRELMEKNRETLLKEGSVSSQPYRYKHLNGHYVWLSDQQKIIERKANKTKVIGILQDISFRIMQENDLQDSKDRIQAVFNTTADLQLLIACSIDGDFTIAALNKAYLNALKQYGLNHTESDLLGKRFDDFLKEDMFMQESEIEQVLSNYRNVFKSKSKFEFEEYFLINKIDYYAEITLYPVLDNNNRCYYILYNSHNVTAQRVAQKELKLSEERYRRVVEDMPNLICCFLPNLEITFVNENYCKYYGKQANELIGTSFLKQAPETERDFLKANIQSLTIENPIIVHQHKVVTDQQEIKWQQWTSRLICDEEGNKISYQAIGEDITERKSMESALQQSELRYRSLIEQSPTSIALYSPKGRLIYGNPAINRLFRIQPEILEQLYQEYNILNDQQLIDKGIMPYIKKGFKGEYTVIPPTKYDVQEIDSEDKEHIRWIQSVIYPVKNEKGEIREIVLIHEDITY
ncbi:MAG: PAS domain S-box protein, partial [Bacteroidales bacterium]|nr:PAS domain S-box protein [Bacteroidales bacterium]